MRLLASILLLTTPVTFAADITGRIVGISDGDTITLLSPESQQHKIRLGGIDAPEKAQPFGQRSKASLSDLVYGKDVLADCVKRDRYGRQLCKIIVDGVDANLEQLKAGMAWWYRAYAKDQRLEDRVAYEQAERDAKQARRGLWADDAPLPPWEWRHPIPAKDQ